MDRKEYLSHYQQRLRKGFDDFFQEEILNGRPVMTVDLATRTYPYIDLVQAYSAGVDVVIGLIEEEQERRE